MIFCHPTRSILPWAAVAMSLLGLPFAFAQVPDQLLAPDNKPPAADRPIKVYILAGQSNMVGMGNLSHLDDGSRVYRESDKPDARRAVNVSLYKGKYSPEKDYDKIEPVVTELFNVLGGSKEAKSDEELTTVDGDFIRIARGFLEVPQSGLYRLSLQPKRRDLHAGR